MQVCISCEKMLVQLSSFCMCAYKRAVSNRSGLFPAILLFNPLIRWSRKKKFSGGHWTCLVTMSYISAGTRPVDTRGSADQQDNHSTKTNRGLGWSPNHNTPFFSFL